MSVAPYSGADPIILSPQRRWEVTGDLTHILLTMQYTENIAIVKASSAAMKVQAIGALSSINPPHNLHHLPNRGVVGHNHR